MAYFLRCLCWDIVIANKLKYNHVPKRKSPKFKEGYGIASTTYVVSTVVRAVFEVVLHGVGYPAKVVEKAHGGCICMVINTYDVRGNVQTRIYTV